MVNELYGSLERLRLLVLPELKDKEDISDWIERGGTFEALQALVQMTEDWNPNSSAGIGSAEDEWPEPKPPKDESAEPYPIDALPPLIERAVSEVLSFVKCPAPLARALPYRCSPQSPRATTTSVEVKGLLGL